MTALPRVCTACFCAHPHSVTTQPSLHPHANLTPVPSLNGVRGLAFLIVVLSHANDYTRRPLFWADGQIGVWLFFVLSSFLLSRQFFSNPTAVLTLAGWRHYMVRRFLRIYPLFVVYVICLGWFFHVPNAKCFQVLTLLTTHAVDWSLYIEVRFYLILPLLVLPLALGLRPRLYICFLCGLLLALVACFPFWQSYQNWPWANLAAKGWAGNVLLLPRLNCFLVGSIAAYFSVNNQTRPKADNRWPDIISAITLLAVIALPLCWQNKLFSKNLTYNDLAHWWFPYAGLFAFWLYLLTASPCFFSKIMDSRPWQFLGAISYPGYLFHIFILHLLSPIGPANDLAFVILALAVVFTVSWALHRLVERPLSQFGSEKQKGLAQARSFAR